MNRTLFLTAVVVLAMFAGGLFHFVFSPFRTQVIEGYTGPANARGVSSKALAETALTDEVPGFGLDDRVFRTRFWQVNPGGVIPIHTHTGRPAIVYIVKGEIVEFRNGSKEGELHRTDEVSAEGIGVVHYWRNESDKTVHLWANDLYKNGGLETDRTSDQSETPDVTPLGVETEIMTQINLIGEKIGADAGIFQLRRLTIAPGGRTAINASASAPFSTYVISGDLVIHQTGQTKPVSQSRGADTHLRFGDWAWWENTSDAPATLLVTDIANLGTQVAPIGDVDRTNAAE